MSVEVGQRWVFKGGHGSFVGEVEEIKIDTFGDKVYHKVRVIQLINWIYQPLGYLYPRVNVLDGTWTLLEGQDRPKN